jgi:phosphomethylpyrimidine synthase
MTQLREARAGNATDEIRAVAREECIDVDRLLRRVAAGRAVILRNTCRENSKPVGVGAGLRVKVNANIGTSPDCVRVDEELEKAKVAVEYGADTIMDLSTGGDLDAIRQEMLTIPVPLGTVPVYQVMTEARGKIDHITGEDMLRAVERHAKQGVDFMTIHAGVTRDAVERLSRSKRTTGIVSRGGSFLAHWMRVNDEENPLFQEFEHVMDIAQEYDVTLSLGDALRPGCIGDSTDRAQIQELITLGELVERARKRGVQCMVEGPGHVKMDEIEANVLLEKKLCNGAPFYVLGPIVTDIAPGYDHITGAIGGAIAAMHGADFLCYVTPAEHLALPTVEDVRLGVIASKIAAHAADLTRGTDRDRDEEMARARAGLNWAEQFRLCLDPARAKEFRDRRPPKAHEACTMCGEFCAMRLVQELRK